jgi:MarR family transcriptional regulator, transcriptional regulator for hemolysin
MQSLAPPRGKRGCQPDAPSQISEIDRARLVGILDRLEAGGWAQRRRQPGDRRVRSLAVTENAKPVLALILNVISDTYVEALQGVSIDEIGTMVKVPARVHSNLSTTINADSPQSVR